MWVLDCVCSAAYWVHTAPNVQRRHAHHDATWHLNLVAACPMPQVCRPSKATHVRRAVRVVCSSVTAAAATTPARDVPALAAPPNPALVSLVEALFRFPPLFRVARDKARATIVSRGDAIGLDWNGELEALRAVPDWEARLATATDAAAAGSYPAYYTQPFHAYEQGNLCWDAALEFALSAAAVHAPVMDPLNKALDPRCDSAWHT